MKNRGEADNLSSKIQWLMFYRAVVVTLLLGGTVIVQVHERQFFLSASTVYLYFLIGITYFLTLLYVILLRRLKYLRAFAYAQILLDVFFTTLLIYFTGGIASIFSWVYLLCIISGGTILYRRGGLLAASASSIFYGLLLDLEFYEVILPLGSPLPVSIGYSSSYVFYRIAVNMVAFYLVAFLSAYLSEQVRRKEEELKERLVDYKQLERLYKHIIQNVTSGLVTVDGAGRVTSFNRMAEEITGLKLEEVYQEDIRALFPGFPHGGKSERGREKGWARIRPPRWETQFKKRDGAVLTLGFSLSPLKDSEDQEIGSILIFQDLTALREMEEELKRADRLAAVGTLAAGMAHEIRNPLASISGSIEILKEELDSSTQNQPLIDIILREVNRLNALMADFLLFARPTAPGKERICLSETIDEILKVFSHSPECPPSIRLVKNCGEKFFIQGDPQQLKQVFWNLFINAAQAMPGGGELRVDLLRRTPFMGGGAEDHMAEVAVSDTGIGIAEGNLSKIFNPFFTTKEKGTGLGLSIVHSIVEGHGGKIKVKSQTGLGATFTLYFPLC